MARALLEHVWDEAEAEFMRPGTPGIEIHADVAPAEGEPVIQKESPNGFLATELSTSCARATSSSS
jgi:nicotinamidase-related amidase